MKIKRLLNSGLLVWLMVFGVSYALARPYLQGPRDMMAAHGDSPTPQDDRTRQGNRTQQDNRTRQNNNITAQPTLDDEDSIPDSLLHPRWKIQRTSPVTNDDLDQNPMDLQRPENLGYDVVYNDTLDRYIIGNKVGGTWVAAPIMMTPDEYRKWSEERERKAYYRKQNDDIFKAKGKEKFDFTDMHFDLGPAEKIFGPGGVRIRTQGSAELKLGATLKNIDNPSLPIRNRKTTTVDFDEKINLNVNGKVGDKVNMNLNYNTDATFDYDAQNMKLKYDGKEDEIIKLVEAGNISFPSNSSLVKSASSLFGVRTDLQFGKLKLQLVASQKKSSSTSASSKGGVQLTPFEIDVANYEENRHFFLGKFFRNRYDDNMKNLPNIASGVIINRIEIWVTNNTATTADTRDIVAFANLGEAASPNMATDNTNTPAIYAYKDNAGVTDITQTATTLNGVMTGGVDYEKLSSARRLSPSEYTLNQYLGYVSLKSNIRTDQVVAVAYEYTYNGVTKKVGQFAADNTNTDQALIVKAIKNTSNNPTQSNWDLMMKNVYYLGSTVERDKFRLDVKYQSDSSGVYVAYIPEPQVKSQTIIKNLGADRLDNNNKVRSNGYFDYVEGYTVSNGRVFFPEAEPFGSYLYNFLVSKGVAADVASRYAFTELYDSTKTVARQTAEKDKYMLVGQFRGSAANVISIGAYNVPEGSVVVTAGGVTLTEGVDYSVDYSAGEVTILNQSIIDAGTQVNVSADSNTDYGQMRKTMFGMNWEYDFNKDFQISGTLQHLSEQALTTKVSMGSEPLNNTLWGFNMNWKKESQWLTNVFDKLPFLHLTKPSQISFTGEFAQLIAGQASGTQDNASYIDDFENTKNTIDVGSPTSWIISSAPPRFISNPADMTSLQSGFGRSRLAWYNIDPLFTRRSSSLTPGHIKSDLDQLSNHYVREIPVRELFPNRDQSNYNGATSTISVLNLAYYPSERGPYNFSTDLNSDGTLTRPASRWGGMMRRLDTNDFEQANIEYIEFWMLDPFIYSKDSIDANNYGGDMYIDLGEVSEDVLRDGQKFYESGMPVDGSNSWTTTQWGRVPTQSAVTYAFATTSGSRALQDVGFNGLNDEEERGFESYQDFLDAARQKVDPEHFQYILNDPAADDYVYFRGDSLDRIQASILDRYKYINNPQGNSPESTGSRYDTSYKTTPDVEDINQDYTLNEYEKFYEYHVSLRPQDMTSIGRNFIVDERTTSPKLRNGKEEEVRWYQFRIPLSQFEQKVGGITDFSSIRFMRVYLTGFSKPVVLRFATFDLVRGEWRDYEQALANNNSGTLEASAVNIEENSDKTPVNYVLPPGITREQDPTQPQLVEANEQALSMVVRNLGAGAAKAVYKNTTLDLRQYKRMQMFVHANALEPNETGLQNDQLYVFLRLGSDYKNNYYEYAIPLKLTPAGDYNRYSAADCRAVWPEDNMLDIPLSVFTHAKRERNRQITEGSALGYSRPFEFYDESNPANKITVVGNPTLGEVKTMMIGVRNESAEAKSGEVWVNELRLKEYNNKGGWAANGTLNVQLSDFGTMNMQGRYVTDGFGGLEDGVAQRADETQGSYSITTSLELGKLFPDKAKVSIPVYYSVTKEKTTPKYNPLDTDMELDEALDAINDKHQRDSIESIAVSKTTQTNFSVSNAHVGIATKRHPMPYDPANFTFTYSHNHEYNSGETTVYERQDNWRGAMAYSWTPVYQPIEPFKKIKSRSKWFDILKRFGLNWLPQNLTFNTDMTRSYHELQERDMESTENGNLDLQYDSQFLWNREFGIRWDLTKNLHMNFQSATHAEIEQPDVPVNKDLYPTQYEAWKDSVRTSIRHFGTPLDYNQSFTLSYQLPINLIPIFDWVNADATYNASYAWARGTQLDDGTDLGNTINNNRDLNINGTFNLLKLYNHVPFLKKANDRFEKTTTRSQIDRQKKEREQKRNEARKQKEAIAKARAEAVKQGKDPDAAEKELRANQKAEQQKKALPKNKRSYEREVTLMPDTTIRVNHGKNSKRLIVTAKTAEGKAFKVKFRKVDLNQIRITSKVDTATKVKLTITPKTPLENLSWYKTMQAVARVAMMVRNVSLSYRTQYSMALPGFMPMVGNAFGQKRNLGALAPGLDFAFGLTGDSYIDKAHDNGWLLSSELDSLASPATTNKSEDLQIRATLEPVKDLKIDLTATRTENTNKSIQYVYNGNSISQSGQFSMTTISLKSAFESMGDATNGYHSNLFDKFCNSLEGFRQRVEARYNGVPYPQGSSLAGQTYSAETGAVDKYSGDVMIPAFLATYTNMGGNSLDLFPALSRLLPNWTIRYSGLAKLPWFRDVFKSFNINHAYKSIFAIGSYNSYTTFMAYNGDMGFIQNADGDPVPHSMYDISAVSINESFSPLLGVDMTFNSNLTAKLEYRKTRQVALSMSSVQINESMSNDWVVGLGYKLNNVNLFGPRPRKAARSRTASKTQTTNRNSRSNTNHDMNLRLDLSYRNQAAITRSVSTGESAASSGNKAFKLSFMADYTLNRLLTMSFYYDRQTNTPLLSSSSYPTTTQDFGLSVKFSLTR